MEEYPGYVYFGRVQVLCNTTYFDTMEEAAEKTSLDAVEEGTKAKNPRFKAAALSTQRIVQNAKSKVSNNITTAARSVSDTVRHQHRKILKRETDVKESDVVNSEASRTLAPSEQWNIASESSFLTSSSSDAALAVEEPKEANSASSNQHAQVVASLNAHGFMYSDTIIILVCVVAVAMYPTYHNHSSMLLVLSWLLVAFTSGVAVGQVFGQGSYFLISIVSHKETRTVTETVVDPTETNCNDQPSMESQQQVSTEKNHSFWGLLGTRKRKSSQTFREKVAAALPHPPEVTGAFSMLRPKSSSSSQRQRQRPHISFSWQRNLDPSQDTDNALMQNLLTRFNVRKILSPGPAAHRTAVLPNDAPVATDNGEAVHSGSGQLGSFDIVSSSADSLVGFVVDPLFKLRGMDVFLSDCPEHEIATHPWFIQQGLRDSPSFTVNILTQWGNIFIYFAVPVEIFDAPENETDPDDVKAAKVGSMLLEMNPCPLRTS
jgi:hypothetical protein